MFLALDTHDAPEPNVSTLMTTHDRRRGGDCLVGHRTEALGVGAAAVEPRSLVYRARDLTGDTA